MSKGRGTRRKAGQPQQALCTDHPLGFELKVESEVKKLFSKVRCYIKPSQGEWCLPDPCDTLRHPPQEHARLQALKVSLNAVKDQLSDKDVQVWHQHTNSTNRAGKVIPAVRSNANAEICTQAWCKFYEILGSFPLLPQRALQSGELNTVHLCEAPGAFIAALNHYLKTSDHTRYCDWSWAANTLNPYHEANGGNTTIADDRLIANTLPWWFFGSDNTGNIMSQRHLLELQGFVGNMRSVDVVTADGSFDCQENPDEQEALVASLHYCEVVAALLLLGPGGSFILKMFTLYEHSSVCLLYLLNCCFHTVHVFKPATSKAGNSEVYVVCQHYEAKEAARPLLSKLIRNYGPRLADGEALFPGKLLPQSFLEQHEEVCSFFHALQMETITENLRLFGCVSEEQRQQLELVRDCTTQEYLQRFQVSYLPRSQWLSRNTVSPACCSVTGGRPLGHRKQMGSFNQRRALQKLSWRERVERGCHASWVQSHCSNNIPKGCILEGPLADWHSDSWYIIRGPALTAVRNSAFCVGGLLNHLNEALEQVTEGSAVWWESTALCGSCPAACPSSILAELAELCVLTSAHHGEATAARCCLVLGKESVWGPSGSPTGGLSIRFSAEPSCPLASRLMLHDGDPLYQKEVVGCVLSSLRNLSAGDSLMLPLLSALTRLSASIVFCLHLCFRCVTFRCPPPPGVSGALLMCVGFCPEAAIPLLPLLTDLLLLMGQLSSQQDGEVPGNGEQVLQFVPMEELLRPGLSEFLSNMNFAIVRQRLHVLMQAEYRK